MSRAGFGARRLGQAVRILKEMTEDVTCFKFLGVAGAMVPCGLRKLLSQMVTRKYTDLIVSTGANITHDLALAFGGSQYQLGNQNLNDVELRRKGFFRIHDICILSKDFIQLEDKLTKILKELANGVYSTSDLLYEIGKRINDENSIVRNASITRTPIIIPAFTDSILGLQVWSLSQNLDIKVDPFKDLSYLVNLQFDLKSRHRKSGALLLGGGVPKNFIMQSALTADKPLDYVIQITVDRPEFGGLSGATLEEAKSWGKIRGTAKNCTVNCDASIALPFIMSALITSTLNK
jgi:deoxyhypusine synthase